MTQVKPLLPPTPTTAERPNSATASQTAAAPPPIGKQPSFAMVSSVGTPPPTATNKRPLTNSAAETQETPIKISARTLHAFINLARDVLSKHDPSNWIAHTCLIATDIDHARRELQGDLYATDESFIIGRDLEKTLSDRGFTPQRVDTFINKVLKVLDGIAAAEEVEQASAADHEDTTSLEAELEAEVQKYPNETREALMSAARIREYLIRGKVLQEKKRLDLERRVKVLEGMVKIGEVVGGVVRYLLTEDK